MVEMGTQENVQAEGEEKVKGDGNVKSGQTWRISKVK